MPKRRPLSEEVDIGSGEKTPGQIDTEKMIEKLKDPVTPDQSQKGKPPACPAPTDQ